MKKYIEIIKFETKEVVKRMDITGKGEVQIDKIDDGLNINLNHEEFYTTTTESETELEII